MWLRVLALAWLAASGCTVQPNRRPVEPDARPPAQTAPAERPATERAKPRGWWSSGDAGCPEGARLSGAPPPHGDRVGCERADRTPHGPETRFYADGERRSTGEYLDGRKSGLWTRYRPTGERHTVGEYADGRRVGRWTSWHANGNKSSEGEYRDGLEHGEWTEWDPTGKLVRREQWEEGRRVSDRTVVGSKVGVPECDAFLATYRRCIAERVPEAARAAATKALDQAEKGWIEAAQGPGREGLVQACRTAMDAIAATCATTSGVRGRAPVTQP